MTLKEKLEEIIRLNGIATPYMTDMLSYLNKFDKLFIKNEKSKECEEKYGYISVPIYKHEWNQEFIQIILNANKYGKNFIVSDTVYNTNDYESCENDLYYSLGNCLYELMLNKGKDILQQITWLK